MTFTIEVDGVQKLSKTLDGLIKMQTGMRRPMTQATLIIQGKMAVYPPKDVGAFSTPAPFGATDGQRKAFWARVSAGEAEVDGQGYRRTGKTGQAWTSKVTTLSNGVRGVVGNNQKHAVYVYGAPPPPMQQTWLGGFPRVDIVFDENKKRIEGIFDAFLVRQLNK